MTPCIAHCTITLHSHIVQSHCTVTLYNHIAHCAFHIAHCTFLCISTAFLCIFVLFFRTIVWSVPLSYGRHLYIRQALLQRIGSNSNSICPQTHLATIGRWGNISHLGSQCPTDLYQLGHMAITGQHWALLRPPISANILFLCHRNSFLNLAGIYSI